MKKRKKRNSRTINNESSSKNYIRAIIKGTIIGIIIYAIMLILFSFIMTKSDFSETVILIISILIGMIAAFVAAISSVKAIGKKGILFGVVSTIPISLLIILIITIINGGGINYNILFLLLGMLISGMIGGIIAVNMRKK